MNPLRLGLAGLIVLTVLAGSDTAHAVTITTIASADSGSYSAPGDHVAASDDFRTGLEGGVERRGFLVFDLSGVPLDQTVLDARIDVLLPVGGLVSASGAEDFRFRPVVTDVATLQANQVGAAAIFADLADGLDYGGFTLLNPDQGQVKSFPLTPFAVGEINAARGGLFATGLHGVSLSEPFPTQLLFAGTGLAGQTRDLVLTLDDPAPVPEPTTTCLGALALAAMAVRRRARRTG